MIQTFNKGKVVLDTIAQFQTLSTTGTLVIDGVTITYDPNHYDYWVKESDTYNKSQVDSLLANKLNKVSTANKVYGTDANGNQTTYDKASILGKTGTVTIALADWTNNVAVKTFSDLGANDSIYFYPLINDAWAVGLAGITVSASDQTVGFVATTTPIKSITLNYFISRGN